MSRYARPILGVRFQWHHRGAYLLWNHRWLPDVYGTENRWLLQILRFARNDNVLPLGMTEYKHSEGQGTDAQKVRLLSGRCTDLRSILQLTHSFTGDPFPMVW